MVCDMPINGNTTLVAHTDNSCWSRNLLLLVPRLLILVQLITYLVNIIAYLVNVIFSLLLLVANLPFINVANGSLTQACNIGTTQSVPSLIVDFVLYAPNCPFNDCLLSD